MSVTFDDEVRALLAEGAFDRATDETIRRFGPELVGWLCAMLPIDGDAHDAFSLMSEALWKSLRQFDGRCSVRTWCYMLARQAASRVREQPRRTHESLVSSIPSVAHAVTHVWNTARAHELRVQDVFARLREQLSEDDQVLLVLRVDRDLPWRDIAMVMLGESASPDELARKAAALRKQFERVKATLRALAADQLRE